MPSAIELQ